MTAIERIHACAEHQDVPEPTLPYESYQFMSPEDAAWLSARYAEQETLPEPTVVSNES